MTTRLKFIPFVAVLVLLVAVGCAKAPQESIDAAKAELDKATQAQADVWAGSEYQAAKQAMDAAQAEVDGQSQKWIKNYDKATELLNTAKAEATKAADAAAANKEQTRKDAEAAIADADAALQTAQASLKAAPRTKDSKADLELFDNDLKGLATTLDEAKAAQGSGDYKKALEQATSAKDKASSINQQLEAAKAKRSAARPVKK